MRHSLLILMMWLLTGLQCVLTAQQSHAVVIEGRVVDMATSRRLPNAQVHVSGSQVATMSNADGRFSLRLDSLPEWIEVSAVGYGNVQVLRSSLERAHGNGEHRYELRAEMWPRVTVLKDVMVYSPENILQAALDRIEKNFPLEPQSYEAFYRETIRKHSHYVSVSEAVVDLYKTGYDHGPERDVVAVRKGRSLMSQRAKDTLSVHVMGGPRESLIIDLVKNRDMLLCPAQLNLYHLQIETPQTINDRPQYVIAFTPAYVMEEPLSYGRIFIDHQTLTFTRIEYSLDVSDPDKASRVILAKKPLGMRFHPRGLNVVMNYHYDGHLSHLSYMRVEYLFDCDWKRRGLHTRYEAVSEMLVTDIRQEAVRPAKKETFREYEILGRELADFSDSDFWADYNILLPSESLEHAFRKLKKTYAK